MSPSLRHRSAGNWLSRSIAAARGAISSAANCSTVSRSMSIVFAVMEVEDREARHADPRGTSTGGLAAHGPRRRPDPRGRAAGGRVRGGGHGGGFRVRGGERAILRDVYVNVKARGRGPLRRCRLRLPGHRPPRTPASGAGGSRARGPRSRPAPRRCPRAAGAASRAGRRASAGT